MNRKKMTVSTSILLLGIIFVAANLRSPLTSVGPLVNIIKQNLGMSSAQAGLITTIPLLAFALVSPMAPKMASKFGLEWTIGIATFTLIIGIWVRSLSNLGWLFMGTVVIGCSIAICNVLIPSLIKREFDHVSGLITGIYSVSMNLCGAIASGLSVPLAKQLGLGWQNALKIWIILAIIACILWIPQLKRYDKPILTENTIAENNVWKSGLAWQVTLFMGLQSLIFYVLVAWLPEMLVDKGVGEVNAGFLLSIMQLILLPFTFIAPVIAERMNNQKRLARITGLFVCIGILGLLSGKMMFMLLSIIFLGIGGGLAFGLSMIFFSLRTSTAKKSAELSGMAQSIGYLLAACGPFAFGYIHDISHSWIDSLIIMLVAAIGLMLFGNLAGRDQKI